MYEYDFTARMAAGKDRAKANRDGGGSTVKVYRTTQEMLHALGRVSEPDNFDLYLTRVRERVSEFLEAERVTYMSAQDWSDGL